MSLLIASMALWGQSVFAQYPPYQPIPRPGRPVVAPMPPGGYPPGAPGYPAGQYPGGQYPQNGNYDGQNQQMNDQRSKRLQGLVVKFFTEPSQSCTAESLTSIIFTGNSRLDTEMCRGLEQMGREKIANVEINGVCQKLEPLTNPISACLRVLASFYDGEYSQGNGNYQGQQGQMGYPNRNY